jgi:hypothetical protein
VLCQQCHVQDTVCLVSQQYAACRSTYRKRSYTPVERALQSPAKCRRHHSALPCRHSASDPHGHQMSVRQRPLGTDDHAPWPHDVPLTTWELMQSLVLQTCLHKRTAFTLSPSHLLEIQMSGRWIPSGTDIYAPWSNEAPWRTTASMRSPARLTSLHEHTADVMRVDPVCHSEHGEGMLTPLRPIPVNPLLEPVRKGAMCNF